MKKISFIIVIIFLFAFANSFSEPLWNIGSSITQFGTATNWIKISAGPGHTAAINSNGELWLWGDNNYGQIGDSTTNPRSTPYKIPGTWKEVQAAPNDHYTMAIKSDGTLWGWGTCEYNVFSNYSYQNLYPVQIDTSTSWAQISCSSTTCLAIKNDGSLWGWGTNFGSLSNNTPITGTISIQRIGNDSDWQQVGNGDDWYFAFGIKKNGTLWAWGDSSMVDVNGHMSIIPFQVDTAHDWSSITCSNVSAAILKTDGSLYVYGLNDNGELGLGYNNYWWEDSLKKVASNVPWVHVELGWAGASIGTKRDGTLWQWGYINNTVYNTPVQVGTAYNWTLAACSYDYRIALGTQKAGAIYNCDNSTPTQFGTATNWIKISAGPGHTAAINSNGELWLWGDNNYGQIGDSTTNPRSTPYKIPGTWKEVQAAPNDHYTMAIKSDGTLWGWGTCEYNVFSNYSYQNLYPVQIDTSTSWAQISCSSTTCLAIKNDGSLWGWGTNFGSLSNNTPITGTISIQRIGNDSDWQQVGNGDDWYFAFGIKKNGTLWAWGDSSMVDVNGHMSIIPFQVDTAHDWSSITCSNVSAAILKTDGSLYVYGLNDNGELGLGYNNYWWEDSLKKVASNVPWVHVELGWAGASIGTKRDGTLWQWGYINNTVYNTPVQVGTAHDWTQVSCGGCNRIAIKTTVSQPRKGYDELYDDSKLNINVYPVPVTDGKIYITANLEQVSEIEISFVNLEGVAELKFIRSGKDIDEVFDINSLSAGTYIIIVRAGTQSVSKKIIIMK